MTADAPLGVDDLPDEADIRHLDEAINRFNVATTGIDDARMLGIIVRDAQGIAAGLSGHTWGGVLDVRLLWVRDDLRGQGYGARLLAAAEREALKRGCTLAILDTHDFQAPEFYTRHGYQIYAELPGYPRGGSKIYLRKQLSAARTEE